MPPTDTPGDAVAHHIDTLVLRVRYLASPKPFVDPKAQPATTLAQLKPQMLTHFGLTEGDANGGRKEYAFSADDVIQSNLGVTLAELAHGKRELELKLLEQFNQG